MAELELTYDAFGKMPFGLAPGERRPLRVPLWEPEVATADGGLHLSFGLPKGSYATSVLRELLARCWAEGCYKVMLQSALHREAAHAFYERNGFDKHAKQAFVIRK